MEVASINNPLCHLAECPLWNVNQQALYWTDILEKRIYKYDPAKDKTSIVWQGDCMVGGFAFAKNDCLVICADKGIYFLVTEHDKEPVSELLFSVPMAGNERFNDITTDPSGRILAGTMTTDRTNGILYRITKNFSPAPVIIGLNTSNGMTFSIDQKYFYHTDSSPNATIIRYEYNLETGDFANPVLFYKATDENGHPDGITIDTEDHIWVACWGASKILRLDTNGNIVTEIPMPCIQPSSVMFGGKNLDELYVTSACEHGTDLEKGLDANGNFLGGYVYRITGINATGRPEFIANF